MKTIILIFALAISGLVISQNLKVVHITGDIYSVKENRNFKMGDPVSTEEQISYSNYDLSCLLYDGSNKLYFRPIKNKKSGKVSDLFEEAYDRQQIASRGKNDSTYLKVGDYFGGKSYLFFNTEEDFKLKENEEDFIDNILYVAVDENEQKSKLEFEQYNMKVVPTDIFSEDEKQKDLIIYRVDGASGEFVKEIEFKAFNSSNEEIKDQIKLIVDMQNGEDRKKVIESTYNVLLTIYGNLNYYSWKNYFAANFPVQEPGK